MFLQYYVMDISLKHLWSIKFIIIEIIYHFNAIKHDIINYGK